MTKPILTLLFTLTLFSCASQLPQIAPEDFYKPGEKVSLFDGEKLGYWKISDFLYNGDIYVQDSSIVLEMGGYLSGVTWYGPLIRQNYEIELDAVRLDGSDFFLGLTFPYNDSHCSLILGGWGGYTLGLSSINGEDAAENETTNAFMFENKKWYHIRLRVTENNIQAWLDDKEIVDTETTGKAIGIRDEVKDSCPLGLASFWTKAAFKNITLKPLQEF